MQLNMATSLNNICLNNGGQEQRCTELSTGIAKTTMAFPMEVMTPTVICGHAMNICSP